jgi:hypothetical protein
MLPRWAPLATNVVLFFSLGGLLALTILVLRQAPPEIVPVLPQSSDSTALVDRAPEARLLGADVSGGVVPPAVQVLGLVSGDQQSAAVLAVEGRPSQSYRLGEELVNGWLLSEVLPNEVVIERSGKTARMRIAELPSISGMVLFEPQSR